MEKVVKSFPLKYKLIYCSEVRKTYTFLKGMFPLCIGRPKFLKLDNFKSPKSPSEKGSFFEKWYDIKEGYWHKVVKLTNFIKKLHIVCLDNYLSPKIILDLSGPIPAQNLQNGAKIRQKSIILPKIVFFGLKLGNKFPKITVYE